MRNNFSYIIVITVKSQSPYKNTINFLHFFVNLNMFILIFFSKNLFQDIYNFFYLVMIKVPFKGIEWFLLIKFN